MKDIIIIALLFIIAALIERKTKATDTIAPASNIHKYPYKKRFLLTKAEYSFYNTLKPLCDQANFIICPKIRMEDFLEITEIQNKQKYRGYIKSRHIDFMICDNKLHILAGIELDDNTHQNEKVKKIDEFKDNVFKSINIPLFRIKMSDGNYREQISEILNKLNTEI